MIDKSSARYRDASNGAQWCARCSMFETPNKCSLVAGYIHRYGWCKHFQGWRGFEANDDAA